MNNNLRIDVNDQFHPGTFFTLCVCNCHPDWAIRWRLLPKISGGLGRFFSGLGRANFLSQKIGPGWAWAILHSSKTGPGQNGPSKKRPGPKWAKFFGSYCSKMGRFCVIFRSKWGSQDYNVPDTSFRHRENSKYILWNTFLRLIYSIFSGPFWPNGPMGLRF